MVGKDELVPWCYLLEPNRGALLLGEPLCDRVGDIRLLVHEGRSVVGLRRSGPRHRVWSNDACTSFLSVIVRRALGGVVHATRRGLLASRKGGTMPASTLDANALEGVAERLEVAVRMLAETDRRLQANGEMLDAMEATIGRLEAAMDRYERKQKEGD